MVSQPSKMSLWKGLDFSASSRLRKLQWFVLEIPGDKENGMVHLVMGEDHFTSFYVQFYN